MDVWIYCIYVYLFYSTNYKVVCMLNKENECSVMRIQVLNEKGYDNKRNIFLLMDDKFNWPNTFMKKVYGKYSYTYSTSKKVKYV